MSDRQSGDVKQASVPVTGVWLRRSGNLAIVAVEVAGGWRDVIVEPYDGNFSHIVEPSGILAAPETKL